MRVEEALLCPLSVDSLEVEMPGDRLSDSPLLPESQLAMLCNQLGMEEFGDQPVGASLLTMEDFDW